MDYMLFDNIIVLDKPRYKSNNCYIKYIVSNTMEMDTLHSWCMEIQGTPFKAGWSKYEYVL